MPYLSTDDSPTSSPQSSTGSHSLLAKSSLLKNATSLNASRQGETTISRSAGDRDKPKEPASAESYILTPDIIPTGVAMNQALKLPSRDYRKAMNDTPAPTAPNSPQIPPKRQNSSGPGARARPTTLDIPGLTRSNVSPDGRIASEDIGSKLVIVMVGLPARGKSYITKKLARYMNWLQHDTRIFNVGERRRVAAGGDPPLATAVVAGNHRNQGNLVSKLSDDINHPDVYTVATATTTRPLEGAGQRSADGVGDSDAPTLDIPQLFLPEAQEESSPGERRMSTKIDQSAVNHRLPRENHESGLTKSQAFFDPCNREATRLREQCAIETLDELLQYILNENGSVGILDATNSTLQRRKLIIQHVHDKAGPDLNVLFIESMCLDEDLLDRNMRLKLSGPDYREKDPVASLIDFKKRVEMYEQSYVPLGHYEDRNNISYVQMVDVGRKIISHQIKGFLSSQAVYYLLNFNLAPRQIWITRHGESQDNRAGRIGGDSELTEHGKEYSKALAAFLSQQRKEWEIHELDKRNQAHLSPLPGNATPPNPHYPPDGDEDHIIHKSFCVWTSMLKRSVQSAQYFDLDEFDIKQMRMLDEINAGYYEGLTYQQIKEYHSDEYKERRRDKLRYRYPGPGGEGYLDVINRLRPIIVELERMTDHVLLIGHRSIARVLLAYFKGLPRTEVADLDVPLGTLFSISPKPYGIDFKAFKYNDSTKEFVHEPNYQLQTSPSD